MDEPVVYDTFTYECQVCGGTVHVAGGKTRKHRCRIDLDRQKGKTG